MKSRAMILLLAWLVGGTGSSDPPKPLPVKNTQIDLTVYGPKINDRHRPWAEAVGDRVVAEGLAWGVFDKGLGQRVLLDYGHIYVRGADLPNGKLVRVVGQLQLGTEGGVPPNLQGYPQKFNYFYIVAEKVEPLEEVSAPRLMEPSPAN